MHDYHQLTFGNIKVQFLDHFHDSSYLAYKHNCSNSQKQAKDVIYSLISPD